jgi:hypothetical protein
MKKLIKTSAIILTIWILIILLFPSNNNLASDGNKTYGFPRTIVTVFWSKKTNVLYDYTVNYINLVYDIFFVFIITIFYFFLFNWYKIKYPSKRQESNKPTGPAIRSVE